jgi:hypothetical protein
MDLKQKFFAVSNGRIINITDLDVGVKYPIVYGDHLGSSVILTLNVNGDTHVRVYLPQRYASVCTERHILISTEAETIGNLSIGVSALPQTTLF